MKTKPLPLVTPGEILLEEFMKPLGLTTYRVAKEIHKTPIAISQIIKGQRAITADMAIRLGAYFRTTPQFWLNLQTNHDIRKLQREVADLDIHPVEVGSGRELVEA